MQRIYKYENEEVSTLALADDSDEIVEVSPPLSAVERLGYSDFNENGEVLATKATAMHPIPQVGVPKGPQDVGSPLLVPLSKPSDLKRRIINMIQGDSIHSLYGAVDDTTDDDFNRFCSDDSDDVDAFNQAMGSTPYACDESGVSNVEKDMQNSQAEAMAMQNHLALMQNPLFQEFSNLSDEQREAVLSQARATIEAQPPTTTTAEE